MDSFCGGMLGMLKILEWARALLYQQPRDPRGHGFSGQRNAEVSAASTAVAVGREAIKGQGWIQMLLGYIQTHQHQLGRNLIIQDFHVCQIDDLWFSSSHAPVRSFSAVKFFRNQSYGEISTAGSWGTGAFFEEQIATTGRLCAKLSHHPSTRNFQQKGLFHFLFFRFFSLQFPLHHHLRGESGRNPWQVCPYFRSNHIAWVHESMHFLYIFGPQLWTLGAREIPMTFTGLCCDLDLWRSAEDVIGWFWFIFGSYWFYICLEDIQSLN